MPDLVGLVAGDGDLVAPDVDLDAGEGGLDDAQQLVTLAEQIGHEVVAGDGDLDLGGRHEGSRLEAERGAPFAKAQPSAIWGSGSGRTARSPTVPRPSGVPRSPKPDRPRFRAGTRWVAWRRWWHLGDLRPASALPGAAGRPGSTGGRPRPASMRPRRPGLASTRCAGRRRRTRPWPGSSSTWPRPRCRCGSTSGSAARSRERSGRWAPTSWRSSTALPTAPSPWWRCRRFRRCGRAGCACRRRRPSRRLVAAPR